MEKLLSILKEHRVNVAEFLNTFSEDSRLKVSDSEIIDTVTGNSVKIGRKIESEEKRRIIESAKLSKKEMDRVLRTIDEFNPIDIRRKRGKFWTGQNVSERTYTLIKEYVNPTFIFEPFVGGGSLIEKFIPICRGVANDIDSATIDILEGKWKNSGWEFYRKNFFTTPLRKIAEWFSDVTDADVFCIYTNPPFGVSSRNALISQKEEAESHRSDTFEIDYGCDSVEDEYIADRYGRGDLIIPSIGRMIEIIKMRGSGYLAVFSQFGIFLLRKKYVKLLRAILRDFEFVYGEVFDGNEFNGVSKKVPVAFTIWRYKRGAHTKPSDLQFVYNGEIYTPKILPLLKDGWNYGNGNRIRGEIVIQGADRFNTPVPKIFHDKIELGGAEVVPENVKIPIGLDNVPDELVYALWSTVVGKNGIVTHPTIFNDAYTHLPPFDRRETLEILAYAVIFAVIKEQNGGYTHGKIGFDENGEFMFGGERLTKGAKYLIDTFSELPVGEVLTIGDVFAELRAGKSAEEIDKRLRVMIRNEIKTRLESLGYWKYLPIPKIRKPSVTLSKFTQTRKSI